MAFVPIMKAVFKAYWDAMCPVLSFVFWKALFPFLLLSQLVVPVYLINIRLMTSLMHWSHEDHWAAYYMEKTSWKNIRAAITVFTLSLVLLLLWAIPLGYCLYSYYWVAARWKPVPAPTIPRKQLRGANRRRRWCEYCRIYQGDRTYHCRQMNKCLPLYDHVCYWWTGAIWIDNIQAYLLFITFLPVYQIFLFGISLWVTISPKHYWHANAYVCLGIPAVVVLVASGSVLVQYFQQLVLWNIVHKELDHGIWYIGDEGDTHFWDPLLTHPSKNPWNQGLIGNLWAIFSGQLRDTLECAKQDGGKPVPHRPVDVKPRREWASSTGFNARDEAVRAKTLSRRHHRTA